MGSLVYLLAIEDIIQSPLIRSQVIPLLKLFAAREQTRRIILVSLYPIINWLKYRKALARLRHDLAAEQITLAVLPLFFLTRHFYIPRWLLPFFQFQALVAAWWISTRLHPAILHCRSYPAAFVGAQVKRWRKTALVFDLRSLYPEEGATRQDFARGALFDDASFQKWKRLEKDLLESADAITAVSQPFISILTPQYPLIQARLEIVPTCAPATRWEELAHWRTQRRAELVLRDQVVVAYAGTWFEPEAGIALFKLLLQAAPHIPWSFLLLVSARASGKGSTTHRQLQEMLAHELGAKTDCHVIAAPQPQVASYLAAADLAAQPTRAPKFHSQDPRYLAYARTVISVKFVEYLAGGLPVLVSRWHGAAAELVRANDLGIVYDQSSPEEIVRWLTRWQTQRDDFRMRAWQFARDHFSSEIVAQAYLKIYQRLQEEP